MAFFAAKFAKNLNKPTSSRKMDKQVIEKNKIIIFIGLIVVLLVNSDQTSLIGAKPVAKRIMAPVRAINQYVDMENLPILIFGKKRIDSVTDMNVMLEIIIVGIIRARVLLCAFFRKDVLNIYLNRIKSF